MGPRNESFSDIFENDEVRELLKQQQFPKQGSNRKISEIDLRQWETLYKQSLKVLKKNELFKEMADNFVNQQDTVHDFKIDYYWSVKDMKNLDILLK